MEYLENLPANCPIEKAQDLAVNTVYRIVSQQNPSINDFISNSALNLPCPPTVRPCRWASCSMFKSKENVISIAQKLPKTRIQQVHISQCDIKTGIGRSYINKKKHVDFWPYKIFDPAVVVIKTEKL